MSSIFASPRRDANDLTDELVPQERETLQKKTAVVVATSAMLIGFVLLLWMARAALFLLFAGFVLAILLRAGSSWIERRTKLPSGWSLASLLFGFMVLFTLGMWLRGPDISFQVDQLQQRLPIAIHQLMTVLPNFAVGRWLIRHGADPEQVPRLIDLLPKVTGFLSSTVGLILGLLLVLYVGITMAAEPDTYRKAFERLFSPGSRPRVDHVLNAVEQNLRRWMIARAISMCAVGLLVWLGLYVLHVPLAGTLGLFAATMTFIPNLGPVLSVIPPALLAFVNSPKQALFVLILYGGVHVIEGWLLTPLAERTVVRLPPALTLSAQLLLAIFAGAVGIALAAPLTLVAVVLTRTLYVERIESEQPLQCYQRKN